MDLKTLTDLTRADVQNSVQKHRLVLFSPRLRNRNVLLAEFAAVGGAYFYALQPAHTTLNTFLGGLVSGLKDFDPEFGSATEQTLSQRRATPADLATALVADMRKAKPALTYLIVDQFDFLVEDERTAPFFEHLVENLPRGQHLIINSRVLGYRPWGQMVEAGTAVVVGDSKALDGGIFDPGETKNPHLEVYGFSTGQVFVNGLPIDTWDGPLPRNLFFYFIDHPMVTRDEIFDTFWPELNTKEATNVFHVTKRKVSERLGFELTAYSGGFYRPSGQMTLHYDVSTFEKSWRIADQKQNDVTAIDDWYRAIRLYRNEFLHKLDMPWVNERRQQLKLEYVQALVGVARLYKSLGESAKAVHYYLRALREVPEREDIHRDLMTIYEGTGQRDKAIAQYVSLRDTLQRTLHIKPSKATRLLYGLISGQTDE